MNDFNDLTKLEKLKELVDKSTSDFTEIRLEEVERLAITTNNGEINNCQRSRSFGGIIRCLTNGAWGISSFNDSDNLEAILKQANEASIISSRYIGKDIRVKLAPVDPQKDAIKHSMNIDFRIIPLDKKIDLLLNTDHQLRDSSSAIYRTSIDYSDKMRRICLVTSDGTAIYDERPLVNINLTGNIKHDGLILRSTETLSLPQGFEITSNIDNLIKKVGNRAEELKKSIAPPSGEMTVVMDHAMAGLFIHEAFGHLCEADNVHRDSSLREIMKFGRSFGSRILNIGDDGSVPGLRASHKYDDEGVPTKRNYLLKDGVLVGRMHNRETAGIMNENLTGNGWAVSYRDTPIVRMTNTFIDPGNTSFEEMISEIKHGIYVCGHFGGSTTKEQFIFNGAYGYMIRDGKLEEMVRNVTLSGNIFQTLHDIDAIGNDFHWEQMGFCGKNGQSGHATSKGTPHIRVKKLLVGGK